MRNYPQTLKSRLLDIICQIQKDRSKDKVDFKQDFTLNGKLASETMCRTMLFMSDKG